MDKVDLVDMVDIVDHMDIMDNMNDCGQNRHGEYAELNKLFVGWRWS